MINNKIHKSLIKEFSFHDGIITDAKFIDNDLLLRFSDGWNEKQINELKFINCSIHSKSDLNDRIIYQILDFVSFSKNKYFMELLIWYEDNLVEVVKIEAENIISKKFKNDEILAEENLVEFLYS